jgi:hypothetical protein
MEQIQNKTTKGNSMTTQEITINKEFARTLQQTIDNHRFDEESKSYGHSPLNLNTRPLVSRDEDGNEVLAINITLEGTVIGEVELNLRDALLLATNITNAVRNRI